MRAVSCANAVQAKDLRRGARERETEPHAGTRRFNDFLARLRGKSCILGPTHSRGPRAARLPRQNPAHVKISRWGKSCEREGRIMRPRRRMVP